MPEPTFYDWSMLLLSGVGLIISLIAVILSWWRTKKRYLIVLFLPIMGMQLSMFMEAWQGQTCVWCLALCALLSFVAILFGIFWLKRQQHGGDQPDLSSQKKMTVALFVFAALLYLFTSLLRIYTNMHS